MHIVVIEDDFHERKFILEDLSRGLRGCTITEFVNVGEFLLGFATLPAADVIITEHFLPLGRVREDFDEWFGNLTRQFPDVAEKWDHHEAAERLVRHLRKTGVTTPIVIYTHSSFDWIDEDVRHDPKVAYCEKTVDRNNLANCVRSFMSVAA